jgi:hypothetical protein
LEAKSNPWKYAPSALIGLVLTAIAEAIAVLFASGGHGWVAPIWFGPVTLVLMSFSLMRIEGLWIRRWPMPGGIELLGLVLLLIASAGLAYATSTGEADEFRYVLDKGFALLLVWLVIWLLPALLLIATIAWRRLHGGMAGE